MDSPWSRSLLVSLPSVSSPTECFKLKGSQGGGSAEDCSPMTARWIEDLTEQEATATISEPQQSDTYLVPVVQQRGQIITPPKHPHIDPLWLQNTGLCDVPCTL